MDLRLVLPAKIIKFSNCLEIAPEPLDASTGSATAGLSNRRLRPEPLDGLGLFMGLQLRPGWELLGRFCPYLDFPDALEGRLGQVPLPGRELFSGFCPYLAKAHQPVLRRSCLRCIEMPEKP
jgi:hypothetical protein